MSRIGNIPIAIPDGVKAELKDGVITATNGKATLSQVIVANTSVEIGDTEITVSRSDDSKQAKAMHGLMRSLINNMMIGLKDGYTKKLEVNGVGYRVQLQGKKLVMNVGYSHPVEIEQPEGITFDVPDQNKIEVKGADKQLVGETAAKIRAVRVPDAYHGKGVKYADEVLHLKEGKTGAKA